jgi:recombination associated protein RdgC
MTVSRLKFSDLLQEQAMDDSADDEKAYFDASFAIMASEVQAFIVSMCGENIIEPDKGEESNTETHRKHDDEELYSLAVEYVNSHESVTASALQRHFHLGYNKAINLLERLEANGVVSPIDPNGVRTSKNNEEQTELAV